MDPSLVAHQGRNNTVLDLLTIHNLSWKFPGQRFLKGVKNVPAYKARPGKGHWCLYHFILIGDQFYKVYGENVSK